MRKLFTIFTIISLSITIASAQAKFGCKLGNTIANVYGENTEDANLRLGIHTGMFMQFGNDRVKYGLETLFNQKGYNYIFPGYFDAWGYYYPSETISYTLNYLDINNNLSIFVADPVSLNVGLQLGLFLGGGASSIVFSSSSYHSSIDLDDANPLDLGISTGVTWWINDAINVEGRYTLGLLDVPHISIL